ncbi:MAG: DUF3592 domain-containing protein [Planctomycetia bacterium]|nr:DUF3592 domain-containing protein [Planctomycetia bacterium]
MIGKGNAILRRLARRFRLFGKKRGDRRTGSQQLGSFGMMLFWAGTLLVGWWFLGVILTYVLAEWQSNRLFQENECVVLAKRVGTPTTGDHETYRPDILVRHVVDGMAYPRWTYDITRAYSHDRERAESALAEFQVGQTRPCWYDPRDPQRVVVVRGYTSYLWLMTFLPLPLIVLGFVGLWFNLRSSDASAERRLAMGERTGGGRKPGKKARLEEFPTVPKDARLTDSPGTTLAYRLPVAGQENWATVAVVVGSLVWNGMVSVFLTLAVRSFAVGEPQWLLTAVGLVVAAVGIWLVRVALAMLRQGASVGRTLIEISDHPLYPGESCRVLLSQFGRMTMPQLRLLLVCDEEATFQQGTNTRCERRRVYEQELLSRSHITVDPAGPFELEHELVVPSGAMHSFRSAHNEVAWRLVVEGSAEGWAEFQRTFPVVIHPPRESAA